MAMVISRPSHCKSQMWIWSTLVQGRWIPRGIGRAHKQLTRNISGIIILAPLLQLFFFIIFFLLSSSVLYSERHCPCAFRFLYWALFPARVLDMARDTLCCFSWSAFPFLNPFLRKEQVYWEVSSLIVITFHFNVIILLNIPLIRVTNWLGLSKQW